MQQLVFSLLPSLDLLASVLHKHQ